MTAHSTLASLLLISLAIFHPVGIPAQVSQKHNLSFNGSIPGKWDQGIPLGNGMLGALVWQKADKLRIALDRADLWDLRPTKEIEKYTYQWAYQHKLSGDWDTVWKVADEPYDRDPAPTKLPGCALEFDISGLGKIKSTELDLRSAVCTIRWDKGVAFQICVDANGDVGRYRWIGTEIIPVLIPPEYSSIRKENSENPVVSGQDLTRLGYRRGKVKKGIRIISYDQTCWGKLKYKAAVAWNNVPGGQEGVFTISSHYLDQQKKNPAISLAKCGLKSSFDEGIAAHKQWWKKFWEQSSVTLPDAQLEKQYFLELYKLGSVSRKGAPPVSLQAVWTADNGSLPPWKGDFHNDLNTQLSYWPAYSSNHLEEASVFTDWLWSNKSYFELYTRRVFKAPGINVPGVATLRGREMGGWHMYAMSPTVSCWLAQHFYWQWKYSQDRQFLQEKAYPWFKEVCTYIENITEMRDGKRLLPMSSSPEFHDGGIQAWFLQMTNFDRALCFYALNKASELAADLNLYDEEKHWKELANQIPLPDTDENTGLTIAPGFPYLESHRHFSHLMSIYPLGLLQYDDPADRDIMIKSIGNLEKQGIDWWCGYSFSWAAHLFARVHQGEKAASYLQTFSSCFCSPNSFHLNGDQCKAGHSKLTYSPFTLEGNLAFASAIQEMLLQSYQGYIEVFPAIPADWKDVSFRNLRAEGAFLVSAEKSGGVVKTLTIHAENSGKVKLLLPFRTYVIRSSAGAEVVPSADKFINVNFSENGTITLENGYE